MHLNRRMKIQLVVFSVISLIAASVMMFGYMKIPAQLGIGRYTVTVELPQSAGLYATANVTYNGVEVGRVQDVHLTPTGVTAVLTLKSDIDIPSDVLAEVHSQSAVGEQYVALLPKRDDGPLLKNGDVIELADTRVPPDINSLLDATNAGLNAIPRDNLKVAIDESYLAVGGLGPDLARLTKGSTTLATGARANLDSITHLIDESKPILDSQVETSDAIQRWAANLASITGQLRDHNDSVAALIEKTGPAAAEAQRLFERLQPTLPIVLANLVSIGTVAVTYQPALEQLLVLLPQATNVLQAITLADRNNKNHPGVFLDFNLNLNLPPPCTTGYLPAQQIRAPSLVDYPERPAGDLYCRIPQDAPNVVRGARNLPCLTRPGKRAPTVKMCESDEQYVPVNDGDNWKGDPNATLSGQDIPQLTPDPMQVGAPLASPPPAEAAPPPLAIAHYDPNTGTYLGPDGRVYTQSDLAKNPEGRTWQDMLMPPNS